MYKAQLRWQTVATLLALAMTWGANMAFIKFAAREVAPLFMAGLRSLVAAVFIFVYMRRRGIPAKLYYGAATLPGEGMGCGGATDSSMTIPA